MECVLFGEQDKTCMQSCAQNGAAQQEQCGRLKQDEAARKDSSHCVQIDIIVKEDNSCNGKELNGFLAAKVSSTAASISIIK